MVERFNPGPLIRGLFEGLRLRRNSPEEPDDRWARLILFMVPPTTGAVLVTARVELPAADQLLAASALLVGALLAGFAQVASWRERILVRHRRVDIVDVRALNEAAAHILISLLVSTVGSIAMFVLSNLDLKSSSTVVHGFAQAASALSASAFTYVALSLFIVTNLLWDAYMNEEREIRREGKAEPHSEE